MPIFEEIQKKVLQSKYHSDSKEFLGMKMAEQVVRSLLREFTSFHVHGMHLIRPSLSIPIILLIRGRREFVQGSLHYKCYVIPGFDFEL